MKLLMGTKAQFKMYLDADIIERLKQAATRFNRNSGQDVVEEIITIYLPAWVAVNEAMRRAVAFQTKNFSPRSERGVNGIKVVRGRSEGEITDELQSSSAPAKASPRKRKGTKAAR